MKYGTLRLLKKSLAFLFSYVPLNFYCISSLPPKKIQSKCPLHIRKGSIDDFQQIADFLENDDPEQVKLLFNKDRESFLAFSGNMLVHTATLCHLKKDEVRICYCETRSNFRGMNIYPTILQYLINYSFTHGKKKCFIDAAPSNKASIRGRDADLRFLEKYLPFLSLLPECH
jgi:hypothetical protein